MPKRQKKKGTLRKVSHNDRKRIDDAYNKKIDEYELLQLHELETLRDSGTIKGTYLEALHKMIEFKQKIKKNE